MSEQCDHMVHAVKTTPYNIVCMLKCVSAYVPWEVISGLRSVYRITNIVRIKGLEP